ncbi:hypothetical protein HAX54_020443, partial [Datura stramonium]|nr:hypothetical protein [Datura stramonium]
RVESRMWEQCGGIANSSGKVCKCGRMERHSMAWALSGHRQWHTSLWQVSLLDQLGVSKALLDEWRMIIKARHEGSKDIARGKTEMAWTKENAVGMSAVARQWQSSRKMQLGKLSSGGADVLAQRTGLWCQDWAQQGMCARESSQLGAHARHMQAVSLCNRFSLHSLYFALAFEI